MPKVPNPNEVRVNRENRVWSEKRTRSVLKYTSVTPVRGSK